MKVLVLGAGVVGVTSAYYLARAGCDVTVVDRQPGPGLETSYANAGEISPGYASPWAGPGVPLKAVRWLLDDLGPLVVRPQFDIRMWSWLLKMLRNCTAERYALNKSRMVRIAEYSRDCLRQLRTEADIQYDHRSGGTLQLFRKQSQLEAVGEDIDVLRQYHVPFDVLDRDGCVHAEPALQAVKDKFVGGLRLPEDETGDCFLFTQRLAEKAESLGVSFIHNATVHSIDVSGYRVSAVETAAGRIQAEAYVMALGSFSPLLLKPLGIELPVYPVKGYSITVPIDNESAAPVSTVMDESYKVAITRLGDRIRVGGTAEVGDYVVRLSDKRRAPLERSLLDLFPKGGDVRKASFWSGLRPMTPDGPPVIGQTRYDNLFLNTGHGTLGWTMACGSGKLVTDLIMGRKPEIAERELSMMRYLDGWVGSSVRAD